MAPKQDHSVSAEALVRTRGTASDTSIRDAEEMMLAQEKGAPNGTLTKIIINKFCHG